MVGPARKRKKGKPTATEIMTVTRTGRIMSDEWKVFIDDAVDTISNEVDRDVWEAALKRAGYATDEDLHDAISNDPVMREAVGNFLATAYEGMELNSDGEVILGDSIWMNDLKTDARPVFTAFEKTVKAIEDEMGRDAESKDAARRRDEAIKLLEGQGFVITKLNC